MLDCTGVFSENISISMTSKTDTVRLSLRVVRKELSSMPVLVKCAAFGGVYIYHLDTDKLNVQRRPCLRCMYDSINL